MTAPSVFISYSHDSPEHKEATLALWYQLCQEGVDGSIDQLEQSPEEGWPLWCDRQVERASFVLVVCTETYLRRFKGEEVPHKGLGGTWEGHIITQELYNGQGKNTKFIPVAFRRENVAFIPRPLQSATAYYLYEDYELLYRRLTGQPLISKPVLGSVLVKPPQVPLQPQLDRKPAIEPLWHVPYRKSGFFTGREQVLTDLRQALEKRGIAALSGLGGVGKTQTALEYAYQYRQLYKAVFWVDAESRETLLAGFASIAAVLNLPSAQAKEQQQAIGDVHRWLEGNPGWLLILDNVDDLPLAQPFLPKHAKGHLLLTTQAHAASAIAERISVRAMTPEVGALLLLRRTGVIAKDRPLAEANETDRRVAVELSKELGGLPLALDQAGAFIEETRLSISEYAELYASEKASLLDERGSLGEHKSVTVTFSLAFQKMSGRNVAAGDLLRLCAFLAPDAIPEEIFTASDSTALGEDLSAAARSKLSFAALIREACRFSLLDRDATNQTLDMHRLIQIVIKAGMSEEDQKKWAERTVRAVNNVFPDDEYVNWTLCQKLIAHCQSCASLVKEWDFGFVEAARLLNGAAGYLTERALFTEAEPLYQRSLEIREKALGIDHDNVAASLNNLAWLYNKEGKYAESEPLYQRSLAILEQALGTDHPDVASILNNLASLYNNQGKYAEAEQLHQRSLAIREKTLGADHPDVAISLNNLALLYDNQKKYAQAEPLYRRSFAILERAVRPDLPKVAASLNNLAVLYDNQGKCTEAEPLYQRSLALREKVLGPNHPDVATTLYNLGSLYANQGKYAEAEPLYQRSLAIREKSLGPDNPRVADTLSDLASLCYKQGKYTEADLLYQRSLAIRTKHNGNLRDGSQIA